MKTKPIKNFCIVLVTAPSVKVARQLSRAALEARLVACANILPEVESHYWWKDRLEQGDELLITFKAEMSRLRELEKLIVKLHPYDTPEFIAFRIEHGTKRYLDWLGVEIR